jgi:hypothetical protein
LVDKIVAVGDSDFLIDGPRIRKVAVIKRAVHRDNITAANMKPE